MELDSSDTPRQPKGKDSKNTNFMVAVTGTRLDPVKQGSYNKIHTIFCYFIYLDHMSNVKGWVRGKVAQTFTFFYSIHAVLGLMSDGGFTHINQIKDMLGDWLFCLGRIAGLCLGFER